MEGLWEWHKALEEEREKLMESFVASPCPDYAAYMRRVGRVEQLTTVMNEIKKRHVQGVE